MRVCLFTDTLGDLNGVSRFIQDMGELAATDAEFDLQIITSTSKPIPHKDYIHNLEYRWRLPMPFYQELDLVFCKKAAIADILQQFKPDLVHISTPGPFGWKAKTVAQSLGYPMLGTYHTDFTAYLYDLTRLHWVKRQTDKVMQRFYEPFEWVLSRSDAYREVMAHDIGLAYEKTSVLPAGTNLQKFQPTHKNRQIWQTFGLNDSRLKVLYVGRINIEKNIPFLVNVWQMMRETYHIEADLVLIGEGRYRKWADRLRAEHIYFLGPVIGEELSQVYAASDLFIFPSVTDTLGQVVMEAQASGLGCMVSDVGGPQSLIESGQNGQVIQANDESLWVEALAEILQNNEKRVLWGQAAFEFIQSYDIQKSYQAFKSVHQNCFQVVGRVDGD
ncbi:glycosyltransferase [Thiomicrorhabdus indica]|uniref:glycosyltransferase n=1 Tax=Thiomicrorhabdus indica TaxID=2267253 RepID=UPI002AA7F967|nr:glycosyltransferase [Thiomicrorhabdus indica]